MIYTIPFDTRDTGRCLNVINSIPVYPEMESLSEISKKTNVSIYKIKVFLPKIVMLAESDSSALCFPSVKDKRRAQKLLWNIRFSMKNLGEDKWKRNA